MSTQTDYCVRWMIRRDMPDVLTIERQCFGRNGWNEEEFLTTLRQRNCIGMVAENPDGIIVGFVIYELCRKYIAILNLAVLPDYQRQGVGAKIIKRLREKLSFQQRGEMRAAVNERFLPMQMFLRKHEFRCCQTTVNHCNGDDSYHFTYLAETAEEVQCESA